MGKKKKNKWNKDGYNDGIDIYNDPGALDNYLSRLIAEGEFGSVTTAAQNPIVQPEAAPRTHSVQGYNTNQHVVNPVKPVNPAKQDTTRQRQVSKRAEEAIPMAAYGRIRFDVVFGAYGPTLVFSDAFGNSIAKPIYPRGISVKDDRIDDAIEETDMYHAVTATYILSKLRMFPDAVFPLNPEGTTDLLKSLMPLEQDSVLTFMSNSAVVVYAINMGYINDIFAPKVISVIRQHDGNVIKTLEQFVPYSSVPTEDFRVFIDNQIVTSQHTENAITQFNQYMRKYCTAVKPLGDDIDIDDILDDFDNAYGTCISLFYEVMGYADDEPESESGMLYPPSDEMEFDPNMIAAAAARTEYGMKSQEEEGALNDDDPFPTETDNQHPISVVCTSGDPTPGGNVLSGEDSNKSESTGSTNNVSNVDEPSDRAIHERNRDHGSNSKHDSTECTTTLGDLLQNAFKEGPKEKGEVVRAGGIHDGNTRSEVVKEGQISVQSSGSASVRKEEEKKKEEAGNMVISVTTCGRSNSK